ncbi:MAG: MBL fold metallo-hydrolase [Ignavibacteriales bacterium]|nr:MBL fold metallo-hydrolase [Ignavibacteriales bacterium]
MSLEILFVGTGSGKTSLVRNHSSILISFNNHKLLIDAGDGISKALLINGVDYCAIDSILFSHFHPDHLSGISSLLNQMKMEGRTSGLNIFLSKNLVEHFIKFLETSYIFLSRLGFEVNLLPIIENHFVEVIKDFNFKPRLNSHLAKLSKELVIDNSLLSSFSFLFSIGKINLFYSGDVGSVDDLFLFNQEQVDLLITEVTHISEQGILDAYQKFLPQKIILTHISDEDESKLIWWHQNLNEIEKNKIVLAYDGFKMIVNSFSPK